MRYFDRFSKPIDQSLWAILYRDPAYHKPLVDRVGDLVVTTSWVGAVEDGARIPGVFITMVKRIKACDGNGGEDAGSPIWSESEEAAGAVHRGVVSGIKKQKRGK